MKKFIIVFTVLTLLQGKPSMHAGSNEINSITTLFKEEGFTLDEWEVIIIDKITKKEHKKLINKLKSSYLATVIKDDNTIKYMIETEKPNDIIHLSIQIVEPTNNDDYTIQTLISGKKWDNSINTYYESLTKQLKNEFSLKFNNIFTCVKLDSSGIIINGLLKEKVWKKLNLKNKSEHYDNVQQSVYEQEVYGYTPLWNSNVIVHGERINFHMILKRTASNKRQVIIGTPIMLNEY